MKCDGCACTLSCRVLAPLQVAFQPHSCGQLAYTRIIKRKTIPLTRDQEDQKEAESAAINPWLLSFHLANAVWSSAWCCARLFNSCPSLSTIKRWLRYKFAISGGRSPKVREIRHAAAPLQKRDVAKETLWFSARNYGDAHWKVLIQCVTPR